MRSYFTNKILVSMCVSVVCAPIYSDHFQLFLSFFHMPLTDGFGFRILSDVVIT